MTRNGKAWEKPISDDKALHLQAVSAAVKRLAGVGHLQHPFWTDELEEVLQGLSNEKLNRLEYLLETLHTTLRGQP
jgi:hypothetical protein